MARQVRKSKLTFSNVVDFGDGRGKVTVYDSRHPELYEDSEDLHRARLGVACHSRKMNGQKVLEAYFDGKYQVIADVPQTMWDGFSKEKQDEIKAVLTCPEPKNFGYELITDMTVLEASGCQIPVNVDDYYYYRKPGAKEIIARDKRYKAKKVGIA